MNDERCPWCLGDPLYEDYHDSEWGVPCFDDRQLFEFLILEGAQAGLSWITVLRKRTAYREVFDQFDANKIACYTPAKAEQLCGDSRIIRNRLKIASTIQNAKAYLNILEREGSFSNYLWKFVDHAPQLNNFRALSEVPTQTATSQLMSRTLKQDGFNFVGPTICYAFMQATGMVNDHLVSCPRRAELT